MTVGNGVVSITRDIIICTINLIIILWVIKYRRLRWGGPVARMKKVGVRSKFTK
jgi:hypothetical protein